MSHEPQGPVFPELPIVNPSVPERRGEAARYGGLFYLGIGGLAVLVILIGWFAHGVWSNRDVWADVYVMHDAHRPEQDRLAAAFRLARGGRVAGDQLMQMSLNRDLPDRARYLLAEAVGTALVARDPRSYALAVARSPGWPDWLRLLLSRPLAYGAGHGYAIPPAALYELAGHADPMIGLWASYALAARPGDDSHRRSALEKESHSGSVNGELAALLLAALDATEPDRSVLLDRASIWLRHHHPQAALIWKGWEFGDRGPVPPGWSVEK
jgi:hypothetical protein